MDLRKNFSTFIAIVVSISFAQGQTKTLAEKLGYPKDAKLLIVHADDLGLSHSTNVAVMKAFDNQYITSASIMPNCPWFPEIAGYVSKHPGLDIGIHLTLTAEWEYYKWGGVASSTEIPGLLNKQGYLYPSGEEMAKAATPEQVEKELKAQIERVINSGIQPTHFDNHMGSLLVNPALIGIYIKLSGEYHVPILIPSAYVWMMPDNIKSQLGDNVVKVDNLQMLTPATITPKWADFYNKAIAEMKPGLNELIVHLSLDNDEMKGIASGHDDYGSIWRQNDLNYVSSEEFKETLKKNHITLITWKQIKEVMYK